MHAYTHIPTWRTDITLHCGTLHCITLHYTTSRYITWHYITWPFCATTLHYITLRHITLHYITSVHTDVHTTRLQRNWSWERLALRQEVREVMWKGGGFGMLRLEMLPDALAFFREAWGRVCLEGTPSRARSKVSKSLYMRFFKMYTSRCS